VDVFGVVLVRFQQLVHAFLQSVKRKSKHDARGNQSSQVRVSVRAKEGRWQVAEHVSLDCRQLKRKVENGQHERRLNLLVKRL